MQDVWLEVALNGSGGREAQPLAPVTVEAVIDEAMACLGEGASILHYHAYDAAGRHAERCALRGASRPRVHARLPLRPRF